MAITRRLRKETPAIIIIFKIAILVFGLLLTLSGLYEIFYNTILIPLRYTEKTKCKIINKDYISKGARGERTYPKITFQYVVDGKQYEASNTDFFRLHWQGRATEIWNQFKKGKIYSCWYNPNQPNDAILRRDFDYAILPIMMIGLAMCGGFIYYTFSKRKDQKRKKERARRKMEKAKNNLEEANQK